MSNTGTTTHKTIW